MHRTIVVNGQKYELQIAARRIINDGAASVSMDNTETQSLIDTIENTLNSAVGIIVAAIEQREYKASCEDDDQIRSCLNRVVRDWETTGNQIIDLLGDGG